MNTLTLSLENNHPSEEFRFSVRRMVNAGYTARDQKKVMKHIEELKKEGIPVPESTPMAFQVISKLVYLDDEIEGVGEKTSGEAEYVLLCSDREIYVGVGSDHTDRELESVSILKSKQVCPNVMSRHVWRLRDIRKDWDALVLKSWVRDG